MVFEGGLPREDYNDKFCVSVQRGSDLIAFDFTSRVITFEVIDGEILECVGQSHSERVCEVHASEARLERVLKKRDL